MAKLNKNSRNMCCCLAVLVVLFIVMKSMKSEGYFKKNKGKCNKNANGVKLCEYANGDWVSARNASLKGKESIGIEKNAKNANICRRKCMEDKDCAGFVHHPGKKMCAYKGRDQIPGPESVTVKKGSHVYVKPNRLRNN